MDDLELKDLAWRFFKPWKEQLPAALQQAFTEDGASSVTDFFAGYKAYLEHPYVRAVIDPPVIFQEGSTRLLDYRAEDTDYHDPIVLFIPSLINRSYILDLNEQCSFLRYLAQHDVHPYLLDFGEPLDNELDFSSSTYITQRVEKAVALIAARSGRKIILTGYCMGGLMALAATLRNPDKVKGLALLATPWDFHKTNLALLGVDSFKELLNTTINSVDKIPNQAIQALFYMMNPAKIYQKFSSFAKLDPSSKEAEFFVSVERWVNDGISVTKEVARECLMDWIHHNLPMKGAWRVDGKIIDPVELTLPTLIIIPENDTIVPPSSAEQLILSLPHSMIIRPQSGHIGMVIGHVAEKELWQPFATWLHRLD